MKTLLVTLAHVCLSLALPPPHPRVLAARAEELTLPPRLRSPALHNPHLRHVLPLTTLLHHGEMFVFDRDTDRIPREQIYKVLSHAGLIERAPYRVWPETGRDWPETVRDWPEPGRWPAPAHNHFAAPPDLLQYL